MTVAQAKTLWIGCRLISAETGAEVCISSISEHGCNLALMSDGREMWKAGPARWTDPNLVRALSVLDFSLDNIFAE